MRKRLSPLVALELLGRLVFLVLCAAHIHESRQAKGLIPMDVRDLSVGPSQERWYGIFFQDQHVGFAMNRSASTADGGKVHEGRSQFRVVSFGTLQDIITAGTALTSAEGELRQFDFFMAADLVRLSARGEVREGAIHMEVQQAGETTEFDFPVDAPPQVGMSLEVALGAREMRVGDEFTVPYFDPVSLAQGEMALKITDVEVLENAEEAYWIDSTFSGVQTRMLVLSSGAILRQEGALGMSMVRMEKTAAMALPASDAPPPDLISLSAVRLRGRIRAPREARELSLRIHGVDPGRIRHQPPMQSVVGDLVHISTPDVAALPVLPLADRSEPAWVESTLTIQAHHPEIQTQAHKIVAEGTPRATAARQLVDWVHDHVEKVPSLGVPNGLEVLRSARGDCNEHTALYVSLARALGIPTRIAAGVVFSDRIEDGAGKLGAFFYHAWPELHLGGEAGWVPVDPTFGQFPADATHIKLVEGDLDRQVEIMAVLGRLGFSTLDTPEAP